MRVQTILNRMNLCVASKATDRGDKKHISPPLFKGDFVLRAFLTLCVMATIAACSPKAGQVKTDQVAEPLTISSLEVGKSDEKSLLTIKATSSLQGSYTVMKMQDPPRVVIEMPKVENGKFEGTIEVGDGTVTRVVTSKIDGAGIRMEVNLTSAVDHEVKAEGNTLEIYFEKSTVITEAPVEKAEAAVDSPAVDENKAEEKAAAAIASEEEPKKEERPEAAKKAIKVKDVKFTKAGKLTKAEIITDGDPSAYNIFNLKSPNRVVIDLADARGIPARKDIKAVSPHIKGARLGRYDGKVRIVFDYKGSIQPYEVVKGEDRISILFGKKPAATAVKSEGEKAAAKEEAPKIEEKAEAGVSKTEEIVSAEVRPEVKEAAPVVAEVAEVKEQAVKEEVKPELPKEEAVAEVKAEEAKVMEEAKVEEGKVEKTSAGTEAAVVESKPEKAEIKKAVVEKEVKEEAEAAPAVANKIEEKTEPAPEKKTDEESARQQIAKLYNGQKISLEFKDADLKNIFRIIADVSGYNMIIDNGVTGKVTLRLVNVPWDQALDIILETNNLGMKKVGNVIRVVPASVIEKEKTDKLASKKASEKLEDMSTKLISVSYTKAGDLAGKLKGVMSDRGTTIVDDRTSTIILTDIQSSIDEAVKLAATLDTPTPQVMIEARIVEASTDFLRNMGVQWGGAYANTLNNTGNLTQVQAAAGGLYALNPVQAYGTAGTGGGAAQFTFGQVMSTVNLDLRLSALETQRQGKVISSPKIITLHNKEASIQQGLSIPFQTTSASGTQTTFIDANLNLTVTPQVTADGRLMLKIKASKNTPDTSVTGAGGAPSINKNEASTEILVKDGDTTVIGGIYTITKQETEAYVPILGKIPLLGWLFKSKGTTESKSELLIFITPRILRDTPV